MNRDDLKWLLTRIAVVQVIVSLATIGAIAVAAYFLV